MTTFTPTIGLEIHAELKTKTKMFCGCTNAPHHGEPNQYTCPVCVGHPGTLPVPNRKAIESILKFGAAVDGTLADYTEFDRKNYFYPDIPKAYQISQYAFPFVRGGTLLGINLTRVHLEEDTARSQHDKGDHSLVDFNRAGVPLMELVTEPEIHDAKTASAFARELQLLLRTLGISDANMERGEMRVEANISVSDTDALGTKVEVKNLNSFKSVEQAIEYEIKRHIEVIKAGGTIDQETRGWDEAKSKTFSQRKKESAHDYRYFPDPDLPKVKTSEIPEFQKASLKEKLPMLAPEKREKLMALGIAEDAIAVIFTEPRVDQVVMFYVSEDKSDTFLKRAVNYLVTDTFPILAEHADVVIPPQHFATLIQMLEDQEITSRVAKDILPTVILEHADPRIIAEKQGLLQSNSADDLLPIVQQIIKDQPAAVEEYRSGKENALQFLVGQGMKLTKGSANPGMLANLLKEELAM